MSSEETTPSGPRGLKRELRRRDTVKYVSVEEEREFGEKRLKPSLKPLNAFSSPLLSDMYQFTMAYGYWKAKKHESHAVFDLFFRKNPFKGEYAVFAGLEEAIRFVSDYRFTDEQVSFIRTLIPHAESEFFDWLSKIDTSKVKVWALKEGTICFPQIPLMRIEGPVAIVQLLETTLLCLINYPTLVATNAARHRMASSDNTLLEFGLRRAQGPDGAISASRYSYMGGFDGTSNVLASMLFGISAKGTMAHSFVTSFGITEQLNISNVFDKNVQEECNFADKVQKIRVELKFTETHLGELKAFVAYAISFPDNFLALVDSYDTLSSGIPNFITVAIALHQVGYQAKGIRLDSGDLAYLSQRARTLFIDYGKKYKIDYFSKFNIVASNDINEATLVSLKQQSHEINTFGIGTNLVTCQAQPALGGVYKLVEIDGHARIKISEDISKVTLPGRKEVFRLYSSAGFPVIDYITLASEATPKVNERIFCRHPFIEHKRAYVTPSRVIPLHELVWDNGKLITKLPPLEEIRTYVLDQLQSMREDHLRPLNPTPYKVSVSNELYTYTHNLWMQEAPVRDLN